LKFSIAALSIAIWVLPCGTAAQVPHTFEAFGSIGGANLNHNNKFDFGGGFVVRPFSKNLTPLRGLGFEFEANRISGESPQLLAKGIIGTLYPARKTATGAVLYGYPLKRTEPYLLIGMGGSTLGCYGLNLGCDPGVRVGVGGLGLRAFLNERLSLRPEFRILEAMGSRGYFFGPGGAAANYLYRTSIGIGDQWH